MRSANHYVENYQRFRREVELQSKSTTPSQWTQMILRVKKARMDRMITSNQETRLLTLIRERNCNNDHNG